MAPYLQATLRETSKVNAVEKGRKREAKQKATTRAGQQRAAAASGAGQRTGGDAAPVAAVDTSAAAAAAPAERDATEAAPVGQQGANQLAEDAPSPLPTRVATERGTNDIIKPRSQCTLCKMSFVYKQALKTHVAKKHAVAPLST